jgi:thiamine-phosphate pyrophosphorylase
MSGSCLLYYITDRTAFRGGETERRRRLLEKIREAVQARVDYIQLREKDLPARELESLAGEAVAIIEQSWAGNRELRTALVINSRTDVALAVGADGVHLRSKDISPRGAREIWECAELPTLRKPPLDFARDRLRVGQPGEISLREPVIGVSCHSSEEVALAAANGANFAVFAPVFGKNDTQVPVARLEQLKNACKANIPVLALGGVDLSNARSCLEAGAAGIAGIRLFQENDIGEVVKQLCG